VREIVARAIAVFAVALLLLVLGVIQAASDAFTAGASTPGALPRRIPIGFALKVYHALDAAAPATYVEATLAQYELERGDVTLAQHYALRLPPIAVRNELLAKIALGRNDRVLAMEYFFAAPDVAALQQAVLQIAATDPVAAYAYERHVRDRLVSLRTHPDAVADAYWESGYLAVACARRRGLSRRASRSWLQRGLADESAAVRLSPLSVKYLLAAGSIEVDLGNARAARRWYRRALSVDPSSAATLNALRAIR
jgi:tetratricopeptide (TPR) repeat protein